MTRVSVKKPLIFSLLVWLLVLLVPATRPMALLDWKRATLERFSDWNPAFLPLDAPYQPEKELDGAFVYYPAGVMAARDDDAPDDVRAGQMQVAPQFAALSRSSNDRDVLVWCARSAQNPKMVANNLETLSRRFPRDAALLSWAAAARVANLRLSTRVAGPLSSSFPNWSVQKTPTGAGAPSPGSPWLKVVRGARPAWDAVAQTARRGQVLEPGNGFWWWLETMALLGARRDEDVWRVLKVGGQKAFYNDHASELRLALYHARKRSQGVVPVSASISGVVVNSPIWWRLREVVSQTCENIIGARLMGRHTTALEGGRDLVRMGRLVRRSLFAPVHASVGVALELITLQNAQAPAAATINRLPSGASVVALAGHPRSLLRYANEQNRSDIARELTTEWNAVAASRRAQIAKFKAAASSSQGPGFDDTTIALAAGLQNTGSLLATTLPIPLLLLALSWPLTLWRRKSPVPENEEPSWKRGLGWSAFSIALLLGANFALSNFAWRYFDSGTAAKTPLAFNAILPRLVGVLPVWAFAFCALVASVGALWATIGAARQQNGELSLTNRLKKAFVSPDERLQTFDARPLLQLIVVVSLCFLAVAALGAFFYLPQEGALEAKINPTWHGEFAGLMLGAFFLFAALPAMFFRPKALRLRVLFGSWARVWRRFLVAHIALATLLYLACNVGGAFFGARYEAQWNRVFAGKQGGTR